MFCMAITCYLIISMEKIVLLNKQMFKQKYNNSQFSVVNESILVEIERFKLHPEGVDIVHSPLGVLFDKLVIIRICCKRGKTTYEKGVLSADVHVVMCVCSGAGYRYSVLVQNRIFLLDRSRKTGPEKIKWTGCWTD